MEAQEECVLVQLSKPNIQLNFKSPTHLFTLAPIRRVRGVCEWRHGRRTQLAETFVVLRIRCILLRWFKRRFRGLRPRSQPFLPTLQRFPFNILFSFLQNPNNSQLRLLLRYFLSEETETETQRISTFEPERANRSTASPGNNGVYFIIISIIIIIIIICDFN